MTSKDLGEQRYALAGALGNLFRDAPELRTFVEQTAALNIVVADLPADTTPRTMWLSVLTKLYNDRNTAGIEALKQKVDVRRKGTLWESYAIALSPPPAVDILENAAAAPPPAVVEDWSFLDVELRWQAEPAVVATTKIGSGTMLLEATVTRTWIGAKPEAAPVLVAIGAEHHDLTLIPQKEEPNLSIWKTKVPVKVSGLRTHTVRIESEELSSPRVCKVVPRAGAVLSTGLWFALAGFWYFWLHSISSNLISVPIPIAGIAVGGGAQYVRGLWKTAIWERTLVVVLALAAVVVVVPRFALVAVRTMSDVPLEGRTFAAKDSPEFLWWFDEPNWSKVAVPACVCGSPQCTCDGDERSNLQGVKQVALGCHNGDCKQIVDRFETGKMWRKASSELRDIVVEMSAKISRIAVPGAGEYETREYGARIDTQLTDLTLRLAPAGFLELNMRGSEGDNATLLCAANSGRIMGIESELAANPVDVFVDEWKSTWTPAPGPRPRIIRACSPSKTWNKLRLESGDTKLECTGVVARIAMLGLMRPLANVDLQLGAIHVMWAGAAASAIPACFPQALDAIVLDPHAAVTIPAGVAAVPVFVGKREDGKSVTCKAGQIARVVVFDHVPVGDLVVDPDPVVRLDSTHGLTCAPPAKSLTMGGSSCELDLDTLKCTAPLPRGSCTVPADPTARMIPGGPSTYCPASRELAPTELAKARRARGSNVVYCTKAYQCLQ